MHFLTDHSGICELLIDCDDKSHQLIGYFLDDNKILKAVRFSVNASKPPTTSKTENDCILSNFYPMYIENLQKLQVTSGAAHSIVISRQRDGMQSIGDVFSMKDTFSLELKCDATTTPDSAQSQRKRAKIPSRKNNKLEPIYVNTPEGLKRYPNSLAYEAMQVYADKIVGPNHVKTENQDGKTKLYRQSKDMKGWARLKSFVDLKALMHLNGIFMSKCLQTVSSFLDLLPVNLSVLLMLKTRSKRKQPKTKLRQANSRHF